MQTITIPNATCKEDAEGSPNGPYQTIMVEKSGVLYRCDVTFRQYMHLTEFHEGGQGLSLSQLKKKLKDIDARYRNPDVEPLTQEQKLTSLALLAKYAAKNGRKKRRN